MLDVINYISRGGCQRSISSNHSRKWPLDLKLTKMSLKNTWHLFQACHGATQNSAQPEKKIQIYFRCFFRYFGFIICIPQKFQIFLHFQSQIYIANVFHLYFKNFRSFIQKTTLLENSFCMKMNLLRHLILSHHSMTPTMEVISVLHELFYQSIRRCLHKS